MKTLAILAGMAVLLFTGYASAATMTSGRPSAVLTRDQCMAVWHMAVPTGRYLSTGRMRDPISSTSHWQTVRIRMDASPSASSRRPAAKAW